MSEMLSDLFGPYIAYAIEIIAGYVFLGKIIKRKFSLTEYIFFIICSFVICFFSGGSIILNLILSIVFMSCVSCSGKEFSKDNFKDHFLISTFIHMIFQMCFAFTGAVTELVFFAAGGVNHVSGTIAMIIGEIAAIALCAFTVSRTEKYFDDIFRYSHKNIFSVIIMLCFAGYFFNHTVLGNVVSDRIVFDVKNLYIPILCIMSIICISSGLDVSCALGFYKELSLRQKNENRMICEKTRSLRHDLKNHMAVVNGLCGLRDTVGVKKLYASA